MSHRTRAGWSRQSRAAAVVLGGIALLVGCSGGAVSSSDGTTPPTGPAARGPDAGIDAHADARPDDDVPDVHPLPLAELAPDAGPAETMRGWHCFVSRSRVDPKRYLEHCTRTRAACDTASETSRRLGFHADACQPRSRAYCFRLESVVEQSRVLRCYAEHLHCLEQSIVLKQTPDQTVTECREYD